MGTYMAPSLMPAPPALDQSYTQQTSSCVVYLASLYPTPFLQLLLEVEVDGDEAEEGEEEGAAAGGDEDDLGEPAELLRARLEDGPSPALPGDANDPDDAVALEACEGRVSSRTREGGKGRRRTSLGPPPAAPPPPAEPAASPPSPLAPLVPSAALAAPAPPASAVAPAALAASLALVAPVASRRR